MAWRRLPFLLGAYIRHLHHADEHPGDGIVVAALDEIDKWVAHWENAVDEHDRRRTSRRPYWQHHLDELAELVGGHDLLLTLDAVPLPDDPLDLLAVDPALVDRALVVSSFCDDWFDGVRRDHSAALQPALAAVERRTPTIPGAAPKRPGRSSCAPQPAPRRSTGPVGSRRARRALQGRVHRGRGVLGGRAGNAFRPQRAPAASDIAAAIGGSSAGVRRRAHAMLEALGSTQPEGFLDRRFRNHLRPVLGSPDLLDAEIRTALMDQANRLRRRLADPDER